MVAHTRSRSGGVAGQQVDERVGPPAEPREPFLAGLHAVYDGPVLLQEANTRRRQHAPEVGAEDPHSDPHDRPARAVGCLAEARELRRRRRNPTVIDAESPDKSHLSASRTE